MRCKSVTTQLHCWCATTCRRFKNFKVMHTNNENFEDQYHDTGIAIIDDLVQCHEVSNIKESLHQMFIGWVAHQFELNPNQREDMANYYQYLQEVLTKVENLQTDYNEVRLLEQQNSIKKN